MDGPESEQTAIHFGRVVHMAGYPSAGWLIIGLIVLRNSLLIANGPFSSCASPVEDGGGNLVDVNGCGDMPITADLSIDLLAENGGPTQTHALPPASPAINAGLAEFCPAVDQRNTRRDGCDVGAFEFTSTD